MLLLSTPEVRVFLSWISLVIQDRLRLPAQSGYDSNPSHLDKYWQGFPLSRPLFHKGSHIAWESRMHQQDLIKIGRLKMNKQLDPSKSQSSWMKSSKFCKLYRDWPRNLFSARAHLKAARMLIKVEVGERVSVLVFLKPSTYTLFSTKTLRLLNSKSWSTFVDRILNSMWKNRWSLQASAQFFAASLCLRKDNVWWDGYLTGKVTRRWALIAWIARAALCTALFRTLKLYTWAPSAGFLESLVESTWSGFDQDWTWTAKAILALLWFSIAVVFNTIL